MTLAEAAEHGDLAQLQSLLASGADPNESSEDDGPPLVNAAYADQVEAARLLLDAGADLYKPNDSGETPLLVAAQRGSRGVFRLLLARGYQFDATRDNAAWMLTQGKGHEEAGQREIVRFLLAHGVPVDAVDFQNCTALTYAAQNAQMDLMRQLLAAGAAVNHRDHDGETVLMWAADTVGHADVLRLLLQHGANVNDRNDTTTAFTWTLHHGDADMMQVLLDAGATDDLTDALRTVAFCGFPDAARLLLHHGANPLAPDPDGHSALDHARAKHHHAIVKLLTPPNRKKNL